MDFFFATWPLARLSGDSESLRLRCGSTFVFPRDKIGTLSKYRGLFGIGLRIEHTVESIPEFIAFWIVFWDNFKELKSELTRLGYDVQD